MNDGEGPDYLELFPELAMREAGKRSLRPRYVTWHDQQREEIGSAEITYNDWTMRLKHFFARRHGELPDVGVEQLKIRPVERGSHGFAFAVVCRVCGRSVPRLFYRIEHWACQQCHALRNRSTYLAPQLRWQEQYNRLRYEINDGRPPGMRMVEYLRMQKTMFEVRAKLDGRGRLPGPEFSRFVFARWSDTDPEA